ncbi:MAG: MazG family protein [Micrococcales bacterium]|nr:MazG family protein [Micrococcales bacterium]
MAYLVQTMDRLRAPGGCPWDAAQDHLSLVRHLLEEAYEAADAIESGDRQELREELGDVLLQVVFHAAIAASEPDPFNLDDIANEVADKLVRRHPQVFGPAEDSSAALTPDQAHARWDQIKAQEKARTSVLDGIPLAQSALARAQKVVARAKRAGLEVKTNQNDGLGERLIGTVRLAESQGLDAETELRQATRSLEKQIMQLENQGKD